MGKMTHPTIEAPTRPMKKKIPTRATLSKFTHGIRSKMERSDPPFEEVSEEFAGFFMFFSPL